MVNRDHLDKRCDYWLWFREGTSSRPGWESLLLDWWVVIHLALGGALAYVSDAQLKDIATTALLPLAGVLVGITFAWATNVHSILQSNEWVSVVEKSGKGVEDAAFEYLNSILLMIVTIGIWGVCAIGLPDKLIAENQPAPLSYKALSALVFFFTSYSIHHSWKVVSMAQMKLVAVLLTRGKKQEVDLTLSEVRTAILEEKRRREAFAIEEAARQEAARKAEEEKPVIHICRD